MRRTRSFRMDASPRPAIRTFVIEGTADADLLSDAMEDLVLGVWEACAHAALHSGNPEVEVTMVAGQHAVEVEVRNPGVYRTDAATPEVEADQRLGVALSMAIEMSVLDEVHVHPGTTADPGTTIRLVKLTGR